MKLGDAIDRSIDEGARVVARGLLEEADRAAARLGKDADEEALHDFRVAIRRLRSALRTFRPTLSSSVGKKLEKRLKRLAGSTNAARDAEVQLAWLEAQRPALDVARRGPGVELLASRIERSRADGESSRRLAERYGKVARKLASRLAVYEAKVEPADEGTTFAGLLATVTREELRALTTALAAIGGPDDVEDVHQARIQGKRLRYLLEPLRGNPHADARDAVDALKALQDLMGDLHDAHVLADEVAATLVEAAADRARALHAAVYGRGLSGRDLREVLRASPRPGLLAIAALIRDRRDRRFAELEAWRGRGLDELSAKIERLASALEARAGGKVETERKFVLAAVPPRTEAAEALDIEQGWLPGTLLRERLRRVRSARGVSYWRAIKRGTGRARLETEEETSHEVFEALWPLTAGRRIVKRRWKVSDGGLTWEIDRFLDRDLVLAEVELPWGAADAATPGWLTPFVVAEVTGDPAYSNATLALAPGRERAAGTDGASEPAPSQDTTTAP